MSSVSKLLEQPQWMRMHERLCLFYFERSCGHRISRLSSTGVSTWSFYLDLSAENYKSASAISEFFYARELPLESKFVSRSWAISFFTRAPGIYYAESFLGNCRHSVRTPACHCHVVSWNSEDTVTVKPSILEWRVLQELMVTVG